MSDSPAGFVSFLLISYLFEILNYIYSTSVYMCCWHVKIECRTIPRYLKSDRTSYNKDIRLVSLRGFTKQSFRPFAPPDEHEQMTHPAPPTSKLLVSAKQVGEQINHHTTHPFFTPKLLINILHLGLKSGKFAKKDNWLPSHCLTEIKRSNLGFTILHKDTSSMWTERAGNQTTDLLKRMFPLKWD